MSSTTDAAPEGGVDDLAAAVVVEEKPGRKFPAPCWTQEETLALIVAYRERWYALRRGYLRTADWDAVAETVVSRCPDASPAKTSAQCRHKMEKLRQRYRAEKQRSLSYPAGRFFSNWFFFENMDAMENGTSVVSAARSNQEPPDKQTIPSGNAFGLKTLIDQNILKLKLNPSKLTKSIEDSNPNPNFGFDQEITPKNFGARVPNAYLSYLDVAASKKEQVDVLHLETPFGMKTRIDGIPIPIGFKPKRSSFNGELKNGFDVVNKEMGKNSNLSEYNGINASEEYIMRVLADRNSSVHVRGNNGGGAMEDSNHEMGVSSNRFLPRVGKKISDGSSGVGCKRERNSVDNNNVDQIAASIRFLGEGFMKIEKMKMEMAKEIEQMRMEREMKQSQMILESQKQMVDCFMKVLSELKNSKKAKKTTGVHEQES